MASPRFTVLIPTHNRSDVVRFAISSVLAQTFGDFELFVAGDGCTDDTASVVASFQDERIRWFDLPKAPNLGYANRNVALREARGEVVAYLGHDDLWLPDHLELLSRAYERSIDFAYTLLLLVMPDGTITPRIANLDDPIVMAKMKTRDLGLGISAVTHRRTALDRFGMWDESLPRYADTELWARILEGGGGHAYLATPTALHFIAIWRKQSRKNRMKLAMHRAEGSLLPELQFEVRAGEPEQKTVWERIARDPAGETAKLRRAIQVEIDRRATSMFPSSIVEALYGRVRR